jgi:hypothetical protein
MACTAGAAAAIKKGYAILGLQQCKGLGLAIL